MEKSWRELTAKEQKDNYCQPQDVGTADVNRRECKAAVSIS